LGKTGPFLWAPGLRGAPRKSGFGGGGGGGGRGRGGQAPQKRSEVFHQPNWGMKFILGGGRGGGGTGDGVDSVLGVHTSGKGNVPVTSDWGGSAVGDLQDKREINPWLPRLVKRQKRTRDSRSKHKGTTCTEGNVRGGQGKNGSPVGLKKEIWLSGSGILWALSDS